jgi:hypothetical protein
MRCQETISTLFDLESHYRHPRDGLLGSTLEIVHQELPHP